ncbi:hypothetical protein Psuf_004030 [Phytohabitans suffuscus]|uniref:FAD dependent oxidoreductase domain-containing protein n=1 Tax=Phytohabitans suffuscus TaxID=624315 RepID=A0A6F8YAL2_9ACTN|nr:hypothetical protein Psuf_004030 [Phytohabitans suffuscus]
MRAEADVLVVGLGIHGSAAAYELARGGASVVGIDQFPEGHHRGSSHGRTRMIRRAYPNPAWNDLVARAYTGWERWERASGQRLVHRTGGLYTAGGASTLQGPGCEQVEDPDRLRQLMPSLAVPDGYHAVFDPSAGVVAAERAVAVARAGARAAGAELAFGEAMLDWSATGTGCLVQTSTRRLRARWLVLATGAWVGRAVPQLAGLFEVWRIVTVTVRPGQQVAEPPRLGAFSVAPGDSERSERGQLSPGGWRPPFRGAERRGRREPAAWGDSERSERGRLSPGGWRPPFRGAERRGRREPAAWGDSEWSERGQLSPGGSSSGSPTPPGTASRPASTPVRSGTPSGRPHRPPATRSPSCAGSWRGTSPAPGPTRSATWSRPPPACTR